MLAVDRLIDIGLGVGDHGGEIIASGTPKQVMRQKKSLTGQYLSGEKFVPLPAVRRERDDRYIEVIGAQGNNWKNITVQFPIGLMTVVASVSASGKSTNVNDVL